MCPLKWSITPVVFRFSHYAVKSSDLKFFRSQKCQQPPRQSLTVLSWTSKASIKDPFDFRNEDIRLKSLSELRDFVTSTSREISGELFVKFNNDLNRRIFELVHSSDIGDKIGGIMAIEKLIDFESPEESTIKVTRFANYLRMVLPGAEQITVLAAKALGNIYTVM